MKNLLILTIISFISGVIIFNFIPKTETIHVSGEIPLMGKRELVDNSSTIIKGIVKEVLPSSWSNPVGAKGEFVSNILQTDIKVEVTEVYKNKPYSDIVTVRIDKGSIGQTVVESEGYPDFLPGENVILFLATDDGDLANSEDDYYVLTGMLQGKFTLDEESTKADLYRNATIGKDTKDTFSISSIQQEIDSILEDLQKNPIERLTPEEIQTQNEVLFGK